MQSGDEAIGLPAEYVVQIDGTVKAGYRLFVDALRAGLQLKQQHPQSDVKVRDANEQSAAELLQGTV
jgi:hypothetical protein